jgi:hypothetical protein
MSAAPASRAARRFQRRSRWRCGADIGSDSFRCSPTVSGDGSIVARVAGITNSTYAKAGDVARVRRERHHVILDLRPTHVEFMTRAATEATPATSGAAQVTWLKLTHQFHVHRYVSTNGSPDRGRVDIRDDGFERAPGSSSPATTHHS